MLYFIFYTVQALTLERYRLHIAQVLSYKLNGARPALQSNLYTALQLSGLVPALLSVFFKA